MDEAGDDFNPQFRDPEESGESSPPSLWDNDDAIESLKMERELHPEEDEVALSRRLFTEAMPQIATKMVNIALYSANDNTSLAAGKYITDMIVNDQSGSTKAKWEELMGDAISEVELMANTGRESE